MARALILALTLTLTACIDFVEPELTETPAVGRLALRVQIPEVAGVSVPVFYDCAMRDRMGRSETTLAQDEPLVLRLSPASWNGDPPLATLEWQVHGSSATTDFSARGRSAPPDSITIPPELLPDEGSVRVVLLERQVRNANDAGTFEAWVSVTRSLEWVVEIVPAQ